MSYSDSDEEDERVSGFCPYTVNSADKLKRVTRVAIDAVYEPRALTQPSIVVDTSGATDPVSEDILSNEGIEDDENTDTSYYEDREKGDEAAYGAHYGAVLWAAADAVSCDEDSEESDWEDVEFISSGVGPLATTELNDKVC